MPSSSGKGIIDPDYRDALRESHERLSGILQAALDCIVTVDSENRIIEFNPAAEATFGYVAKEVIGRDMTELVIPPPFRAMHRAGMQRYLATGETRVLGRRIEIIAMRADHSEFPCELTITHLRIAGRPVFTAFLRDITELKKTQESAQQLNSRLEQEVIERTKELQATIATLKQTQTRLEEAQSIGSIGDIEVDLETLGHVWSDHVFVLYSFPIAPLPPPIEDVIARVHPMDQVAFRQFMEPKGHSETEKSLEYRAIRNDGAIIWLIMKARAKHRQSGRAGRILQIIVQDITRRKTLERELLATIDKEQDLGRLKTSFLQMVTHEYRTPLGIITSSAEILEKYSERLDPKQRQEQLQNIRSSTRRLASLLDDVLFLGKTDSGLIVLKPEPIALKAWLQSIAAEVVASFGADRVVTVETNDLPSRPVRLDKRLVRHVMNNLISNALKYSKLDQAVRIGAGFEKDTVVISVVDEGIGIPKAELEKLFQMFQRASNVGTVSGSGLGLFIVKRCVDLHDGKISVSSTPGAGTKVTVRFPELPAAARKTRKIYE